MNPEILNLLACPLTRQPLTIEPIDDENIPSHWTTIGARHGLGKPVNALVASDGSVRYPVWSDVIGLLPEFAVRPDVSAASVQRSEKKNVARFYDEFGWLDGGDGNFNDALAFEDLRDVTAFYRDRCHRRVNRQLPGGNYLLDVASGAVQIPAYRSFSEHYAKRICVDLSLTGLRAAKQRLGDHAVCIAGDITRLPLRDGAIDSVVSLHTLYHVPADEQATAVAELYRVTRPGGRIVIVSSWGASSLLHRAWVWAAARLPQGASEQHSIALPTNVDLYFSPQDYAWYRREIAPRYASRLRIWRSVGKEFMQRFVHGRISAWLLLGPLLMFESIAPRLAGRIGVCPMFVIDKPRG